MDLTLRIIYLFAQIALEDVMLAANQTCLSLNIFAGQNPTIEEDVTMRTGWLKRDFNGVATAFQPQTLITHDYALSLLIHCAEHILWQNPITNPIKISGEQNLGIVIPNEHADKVGLAITMTIGFLLAEQARTLPVETEDYRRPHISGKCESSEKHITLRFTTACGTENHTQDPVAPGSPLYVARRCMHYIGGSLDVEHGETSPFQMVTVTLQFPKSLFVSEKKHEQ